ncbi:hypothetical protein BO71DRAFT_486847 [Aspergillus ellipticus CBS 707.79]|uniref:Uncharacterized protein n=1 Tax=Aspergillus ellipticus CBS 707.79 TaxID=1448320 RepID=A0A319D178_9EURO|nr:hypothetical protein BO71DRAFT_486847 [Aspergillus ellipticus CBS 707.79]
MHLSSLVRWPAKLPGNKFSQVEFVMDTQTQILAMVHDVDMQRLPQMRTLIKSSLVCQRA